MKRCFNMAQTMVEERVLYLVLVYYGSCMSESFEKSIDEAISAANKGLNLLGSVAKVYRQSFVRDKPVGDSKLIYHATVTRTVQYDERIDAGGEDIIFDA